ncbi:MAG TPA: tetratricopeptide repeat protein [Bacteroidia bacterium]|jgi:tetratricopeptide (TPR) repeat protein
MKRFLFLGLVVLPQLLFAQSSEDLFKEGQRRYTEKNYAEAETFFNKAITANKDSAKYYVMRGKTYFNLEKYKEAFRDYCTAIDLDKGNVEAYLLRADFLLNVNKPYESIKDANMAIMLTHVDTVKRDGYLNNGMARLQVRDFEGAFNDLMKAYSYDSLDPAIFNEMGHVFMEQGDTTKAIYYARLSFKLDTSDVVPLANIAFIRSSAGNYKDAMPYFDMVIKRKPLAYNYNNRGYARFKLGDIKGALDDINRSIKMDPTNSYAYRNRALVYIEMNKMKKVCADLNKAKELGFKQQYGNEVDELQKKYCK